MLKRLSPHVLRTACDASRISFAKLAERTGISEEKLLGVDEGRIGLSPKECVAILERLAEGNTIVKKLLKKRPYYRQLVNEMKEERDL